MAQLATTVCITRGAEGCAVLNGGGRVDVPAPVTRAVDTNGAGDMFAGAFLYATTHGHTHTEAAHLGNVCAAAVVSRHGARLDAATLQHLAHAQLKRCAH